MTHNNAILIIDDNSESFKLLNKLLKDIDYDIIFANNAKSALTILEDKKPDLILLNIELSDISGLKLCKQLKLNEKYSNTPIIFLIKEINTENITNIFNAGGVDYVHKPLIEAELLSKIKTHISLSKTNQNLDSDINIKYRKIKEARDTSLKINNLANTLSIDQILESGLEECERLTQSKIGFIHFVNDNQKTIKLKHWTANTIKNCSVSNLNMESHIESNSIWLESINRKKPVIYNNYLGINNKKELPKGHVQINKILTVPVINNNKVVLIIGVSNKHNDYEQIDIDLITIIADNIWNIVERKYAELKLKQSEETFRLIFNQSPLVVIHYNKDGYLIKANNKAYEVFGVDHKSNLSKYTIFSDPTFLKEDIESLKKGKIIKYVKEFNFAKMVELKLLQTKCKGIKIMDVVISPMFDNDNKIIGYISQIKDITVEAKAQQELKKSKEKFFKAFMSGPFPMSLITLNTRKIVNVNKGFEDSFGYLLDELIGKTANEVNLWRGEDSGWKHVNKMLLAGERIKNFEVKFTHKRGTEIIALLSAEIININDTDYVLSVANDITQKKKIEQKLIEKESLLSNLLNNIPAYIYVKNTKGNYEFVNAEYEKKFNVLNSKIKGKSDYDFFHKHDADIFSHQDKMVIKTRKKMSFDDELYINNYKQTFYTQKAPIIINGNITSILGLSIDTTEENKIKQELLNSKEKYQVVADYTYDWEYWLSPKNKFIYVSPSCKRITGYTTQEFLDNQQLYENIIQCRLVNILS